MYQGDGLISMIALYLTAHPMPGFNINVCSHRAICSIATMDLLLTKLNEIKKLLLLLLLLLFFFIFIFIFFFFNFIL